MDKLGGSAIDERDGWGPRAVPEEDEVRWIKASQRGEADSFNHLVLKWEKPIYNLSLRMLQDPEEAAEVSQEVFLIAFKSIRQFRGDAKFSTWLYRIASNLSVTRLRRRPAAIHCSLDDEAGRAIAERDLPPQPSHEESFLKEETRRRVSQVLAVLPADQRLALEMKFYREMTFEEIAECLGTPVSTVKTRVYSALEMMKSRLAAYYRRSPLEKRL
jgi:RNA polymerase sigma-70 factor (ECF subfamily)